MDPTMAQQGSGAAPEPARDDDNNDPFKIVMAILIAIVAVAGAVAAWRAAVADAEAGDSDFAAVRANINAAETRIVNTTSLYENYRAYTAFTEYRKQQALLEEALESADEAESEALAYQWAIAAQLASDNEFYFSKRYLNEDGSYNSRRDLGEAWAEAGQKLDLDPASHLARAERLRLKSNRLVATFIVLAMALLFYTAAEGIHPGRKGLRYGLALAGTLFLIGGIVAAVILDLSSPG